MLNGMNTNTPSGMLISPVLSSDFLPYDLINNGVTIKDTTVTAQMSYVNCDIVLNDPNQYITGSVTWSLPPLRFYLSALAFKETS